MGSEMGPEAFNGKSLFMENWLCFKTILKP